MSSLFSKINKTELKRALSNLINNSVEAFDLGGEVKINLIKNKEQVHISVEDNGKGIPKDIQKHLFERKRLLFGFYGLVDCVSRFNIINLI